MTYSVTPEIECPECEGSGWVGKRLPRLGGGVHEVTCEHCNGHGWREMTEDEIDAASEKQAEDVMSEPPMSLDEQHARAWQQKQELRR